MGIAGPRARGVRRRADPPAGTAADQGAGLPPAAGGGPRPSLSVLLPVHNGADTIAQVIEGFYRHVVLPLEAELIVCEDGSTDGTDEVLRSLAERFPLRLISGPDRKGYGRAIADGFAQVRGDLVFFSDSDGQYEPRDFWRLWPYAASHDMVVGHKVKRDEPFHRIALSRGFHVLAKALFAVPLADMDCGFRLLRRPVFEEVLPLVGRLPYSFWAEFTTLAYERGFRIVEVPVDHRPRLGGTTTIYTFERLPWIVLRQLRGLVALRRALRRG